jgi:uncharacterized protein YbjQ (UPF0145 family)
MRQVIIVVNTETVNGYDILEVKGMPMATCLAFGTAYKRR